jgi:3',5'-cyclic-AMP phosphodiesterase
MKIVQMSDIHVGSYLFRPDLLSAVIEETNALSPDLVAVVGDLTTEGYRWEFEEAKGYLDRIECPNVVVAMGNHDSRSVGYRHFEELFGMREGATTVAVPEGEAKVVVLDSTKPDLDEGEVGREHYAWLDSEFRGWDRGPRILVVHHHILAVPGTGRDVNILRDAGDVMAILRELRVDIVLSGHRHVPYVWSISGVRIVHSGTASSMRVRGMMPPSYNLIEFGSEEVRITLREPGKGEGEPLASFAREAVTTSRFFPEFDRFVKYDRLPFPTPPTNESSTGVPNDDAGGGPKR